MLLVPASSGCDDGDPNPGIFEPEAFESVGGELRVELNVQKAQVAIGDRTFTTRTYNGEVVGPTLIARPGETIYITLRNQLEPPDEPSEHSDHNMPNHFETTNLHTHGLHVDPRTVEEGGKTIHGDDVLVEFGPGGAMAPEHAYRFVIPSNHPEGTYWYHAHRHGASAVQVMGGLAGALILRGATDEVPEISAAKEVLMVLQEFQLVPNLGKDPGDSMLAPYENMHGEKDSQDPLPSGRLVSRAPIVTINGVALPTLYLRPGEVQRWRFIHAGFHDHLPLRLEEHQFTLIAVDGITLAEPLPPSILWSPLAQEGGGPLHEDTLSLAPGNRCDVLVKGGKPGTYRLYAQGYSQSAANPDGTIKGEMPLEPEVEVATVVVLDEEPQSMQMPTSLPQQRLYTTVTDAELMGKPPRTLFFAFKQTKPGVFMPAIGTTKDNAEQFNPDDKAQILSVTRNTVEEWEIKNTAQGDHPFHIHVSSFMVTEIDGKAVERPFWQDTAVLPRRKGDAAKTPGQLKLRTRYLDFTGKFVLHCHMLEHEDMGMMRIVEAT